MTVLRLVIAEVPLIRHSFLPVRSSADVTVIVSRFAETLTVAGAEAVPVGDLTTSSKVIGK